MKNTELLLIAGLCMGLAVWSLPAVLLGFPVIRTVAPGFWIILVLCPLTIKMEKSIIVLIHKMVTKSFYFHFSAEKGVGEFAG